MPKLSIDDLWDDAVASAGARSTLVRRYGAVSTVAVLFLQGVASQSPHGEEAVQALALARRMQLAIEGLATAPGVEVVPGLNRVALWADAPLDLFDVAAQAIAHLRGGHHDHSLVSVGFSHGYRASDGASVALMRAERLAVSLGPGVLRGDAAFRDALGLVDGIGVHSARQGVSAAVGFEVFEFADYRDP